MLMVARYPFFRGFLALGMISAVVAVIGCSDDDSSSPTGPVETLPKISISGHVYYDDAPFAGVGVFLTVGDSLRSTSADGAGVYTFDNISSGDSCTVRVLREEFRILPMAISFVAPDSNIVLEDITAYRIHIVDNPITFVSVPGGSFAMGSDFEDSPDKPEGYNLDFSNEQPVHTVTVDAFEMSATEITEDQFARFLTNVFGQGLVTVVVDRGEGATAVRVYAASGEYAGKPLMGHGYIGTVHGYNEAGPHNKIEMKAGLFTGRADIPVKWVSWYGAKMFAEYYGYDLPTEAEWEYACRGGKGYDYGTADGAIGTDSVNYQPYIGPPTSLPMLTVTHYPANPFGLYEMSGNVNEWCRDYYEDGYYATSPSSNPSGSVTGTSKAVRGGGFSSPAYHCRASFRFGQNPDGLNNTTGFRVVRR